MTTLELNLNSLTELAKSVLDIEANSIIKLKDRINGNLTSAVKTIITGKVGTHWQKNCRNLILNGNSRVFSSSCGKHPRGFGGNYKTRRGYRSFKQR